MKYAILCSFVLGSASVAYGQSRMPPPTYNNGNSSSGWDNPQTRNPLTGSDPANRVGTFQIMLQAPPLVADTLQEERGFGLVANGAVFGYFGLSGAVGYTLTSLFEIGGGVTFHVNGVTGGADYGFLLEPFLKLNLGPAFKTGAINPFVLAGIGFGFSGTPSVNDGFGTVGGGGTGNLAFEVDPGVEWLVGGRWGFDFYIPIQFNVPLSGGNVDVLLGAAYGIVAYL